MTSVHPFLFTSHPHKTMTYVIIFAIKKTIFSAKTAIFKNDIDFSKNVLYH